MESTRPQTPDPRPSEETSLITGAAGFVGQYLAQHLIEQGQKVVGIDLNLFSEPTDYPVEACDLLDFGSLNHCLQRLKPQLVYHLAGLTHPKDSLTRPRDYYAVNVQGTVNLLEALRQGEIDARILIVSSSKVYGKVPPDVELIEETLAPRPETPYAVSKHLAEQVALQYFRNYGMQVVIVRPFNHTGPGQPSGFVVPDFCRQMAEMEQLSPEQQIKSALIVHDLSPVLDLLDVRDVVQAYDNLVEHGRPGEIYNVSSGRGIPVRELVEQVIHAGRLQRRPPIQSQSNDDRPPFATVGSVDKLRKTADWQIRYSLQQTIVDTLAYWRKLVDRQ